MYHSIVRRVTRRNFERVNLHDYDALLRRCAPDIRHRFGGNSPLGGVRHDREHFRLWLERLGRLGPELRLDVHDVWVKGWPHHTYVVIRWTATQTLPDGQPYLNRGVHIIEMRWLTVVDIDAHEDSQVVADSMPIWAAAGVPDASAPPIVS